MSLVLILKRIKMYWFKRKIALFYFKSLKNKFSHYEYRYIDNSGYSKMVWKGPGEIEILFDRSDYYYSYYTLVNDPERLDETPFRAPKGIGRRINRYLNKRLNQESRKKYIEDYSEQLEKSYNRIYNQY